MPGACQALNNVDSRYFPPHRIQHDRLCSQMSPSTSLFLTGLSQGPSMTWNMKALERYKALYENPLGSSSLPLSTAEGRDRK